MKIDLDKEIEAQEEKGNNIEDGVYDISDIDYLMIEDSMPPTKIIEATNWIKEHPTFWVANAYNTDTTFLLSEKPKEIDYKNVKGSGFNYGSTNIIIDCPKKILILAEDD